MVEYVFENKRLSASSAVAIVCPSKQLANLCQDVFDDFDAETVTRYAHAHNVKAGEVAAFETAKRKIILAPYAGEQTDFKTLGAKIYRAAKKELTLTVVTLQNLKSEAVYQMAFGMDLASYSFDKYLTTRPEDEFAKLETVIFKHKGLSSKEYIPYAALSNGVRYARDLTNEPANNMTPKIMADDIKRLGYLGLEIEILDEKRMLSNGFHLALSVAQGSANRPYVALIKWIGNKSKDDFDLGLVGKGVTFDAGGISLKPGNGMWDMKQDMAGAAAVVGALKAAALQKLPVNLIGAIGLVENMPSGTATRPGDIVKSMSGQTVEILNTDAEGRLVLADLLWYVQDIYGVNKVIDIATLTGAVMVALGTEMAGVMGNSQKFVEQIKKAGQTVGEEVWQLPLNKAYNKMMDSDIADMKNISESRNAGTITAACFLERFIKKDTVWAHLDIAGMDKESKGKPLTPKGATGFGVRLFDQIIKTL